MIPGIHSDLEKRYKNKAALAAHGSTPAFKTFYATIQKEDLVSAPTQLKFVKEVGGFGLRRSSKL